MCKLSHVFEDSTYETENHLGIYVMDDFGTLVPLTCIDQLWYSLYDAMDHKDVWK